MSIELNRVCEEVVAGLILTAITTVGTLVYKNKEKIFYFFKKIKILYFPVNFNVGLSIQFDKQLNSGLYFSEIRKNLLSIIEELGLLGIINIYDFSDTYIFSNKEEAEKYRQKKNLDLVVWGSFTTDGLKVNNQNVSTMRVRFTYGYPKYGRDKENKLGRSIALDINSRLAIKKYWSIIEDNSLTDVLIISNNLADISLYIIGLTLKWYGRLDESLQIFERIFQKLTNQEDDFKKLILPHLIDCYALFIIDVNLNTKNFSSGVMFCERLLSLENNNHFALTNIAIFSYKRGEYSKCEEAVEKLLEFYPGDPITEVNVAFIRILQKRYKNAYKHYEKLVKMSSVSFNPQEVVEFLSEEYKKIKDPALLYGSGILSFYFGDKIIAKDDISEFLRIANISQYKSMYRNAKKILSYL